MGFVLNIKVVDLLLSFPTHMCTPHLDNLNQSYDLHSEQGSEHVKYEN